MKKQVLINIIAIIALMFVLPFGAKAQAPTYICEIRNDSVLAPNIYQFDIYLVHTGGAATFQLAGIQSGFKFNNNVIPAGATITPTIVSGASTLLTCNQPKQANLTIVNYGTPATKGIKITAATPVCGAGNGSIISQVAPGNLVCRVRLTCSAPYVSGTQFNLQWNFTNPQPWPSKVFYYTTISVDCTVPANHLANNLTNPLLNAVSQFPMGPDSTYCYNSTGAHVSLTGSQTGYDYTLIKNGTTTTNVITGTGSALDFGVQTAGIYKVIANPGATLMNDSTVITENLGTIPTFAQLGPYCVNDIPGVLPLVSNNGIAGTWNPAVIVTSSQGSTVYTFTPTPVAGQCLSSTTLTVVVNSPATPTFTQLGPYCVGATPGLLPATSSNGYTGTWNPATINTSALGSTTYTFTPDAGQCAHATTMEVSITSSVTPTFTQLGPYCIGATPGTLPTTSINTITGTWNPAIISTSAVGSITYTFTPDAGQCGSTTTMSIVVNGLTNPTFTQLGPYCVGATPGTLPATSSNGITGTWNPATISTTSAGVTTYTFTPTAGQCAATATMDITITANITPTFTQLGPYCYGATPGTLPATSNNGITGTWNPATIATNTVGSATYTFTPTAGQCATTATMSITTNSIANPVFSQLGPYCVGATPGTLPLTSVNGINGTWNPSTISTSSAGSTTYTFTPNAGQCANTKTMNIVVNANVTPTFTQLGPYCVGATPATLPTTSTNSITGTWNPATISTAAAGSTTYTFTPTAGQCATTATMSVVVDANVTPTFTQLGPYCVGATPGTLPATSSNGITGTWNPATISTASAGSTTYTFTPTAGQCATTATMSVVVNANVTPTFTQLGPYCVGATPGALPLTSNNSITGTWNPATISTSAAGSTTYTFTPTAGQCATTKTMSIVVNSPATPTFTQLGPYCVGATPGTLPATSTNSITGTWNPATISTASAGSTTYTFTPNAGQCGTTTTMSIVVNANTTPTFTQLGPYCAGATPGTLPTTSSNGVTGTWNPATISTSTAGSTTYTFTPTAGQCATTATMSVVVNANVTPTFTQLGPYCINDTPGTLPLTSNNSIPGTWNPATISTATVGSTTYTFTPTAGQCTTTATMSIVISACTDVQSLQDISRLVVYPNPSSDRIFVNFGDIDMLPQSLSILNSLGQVCYQTNTPLIANQQGIDISGFATGTYTVQVVFDNKVVNKTIIVNKN
jgi:hypothetical protein